jgi:hypothetical protein
LWSCISALLHVFIATTLLSANRITLFSNIYTFHESVSEQTRNQRNVLTSRSSDEQSFILSYIFWPGTGHSKMFVVFLVETYLEIGWIFNDAVSIETIQVRW